MSTIRVLSPVVSEISNMEEAQALNVARLEVGKLRVGLLDNTKPNARLLLDHVGEMLKAGGLAASVFVIDKTDSPGPNPAGVSATRAVFQRLKQDADIVLTGLGN